MSKGNEPEERKLLIRLSNELHRQVRLLAYDLNISMAQLCREGLELMLQKNHQRAAKTESKE
ncbi:hypothetical protein [Legionella pneumophila]|uniref:hypothetical protein n=1 Tax=Legionella pneumophila TaxID=446 RepID=UPI001A220E7C|nr:hypothetical protein [Legionella pneumophila]HAT1860712.1 hypothetical protein [Legionella pneumophila]HAU2155529.1 hypothetical protein [Legionella pneumophila]